MDCVIDHLRLVGDLLNGMPCGTACMKVSTAAFTS
jgi:hypothetical protein